MKSEKNDLIDTCDYGTTHNAHRTIRKMCVVGVFTALMCVLSPISIPLEPVSITLATLVVYLIGALLDWKIAIFPVLLYILLGFAGLPVFSKFQGGASVILGPTGGYILGYVLCVFLESVLISFFKKSKWIYAPAMILGTILLYAFGTGWFCIYANYEVGKALMVCVVPFLLTDMIKIIIATVIGLRLREFIDRKIYR